MNPPGPTPRDEEPLTREPIATMLLKAAAIVGAIVVGLNVYAPADPPVGQRVGASLLVVLGSLPTIAWLTAGRRGIPFMPTIGAVYALYYGVPVLLTGETLQSDIGFAVIPEGAMQRALNLSAAGVISLYCGYLLGSFLFRRVSERRTSWTDINAPLLGGLIGGAGLLIYLYSMSQEAAVGFGQTLSLGSSLAILGALVLYAAQKQGTLGVPGWIFLWIVLIPIRVLAGFGTGANYQGLEILVAIGLAGAAMSRKLPWKAGIVFLITLIVLQPVKAEFRSTVLIRQTGEYRSPLENSSEYLRTAKEVLSEITFADTMDEFVVRFGYIRTLAQVVEVTPSLIPYWRGESYATFATKLVPRILYPNKPEELTGQSFGHRYGFLSPTDTATSFNLAQLLEFYVNYGPWGIGIGMFLLGVLYRLFKQFVGGNAGDVGGAVLGAYVLSSFLLIENSLAAVLAGTLFRLVIGLLIARAMRLLGGSVVFPTEAISSGPRTGASVPA